MPKHPHYDATDRLALLMHEGILGKHGKTGLALLRFAPERIAAVIDSQIVETENSDGSLADLTGIPLQHSISIVASAEEALAYGPQTLAIGIAPLGGKLPEAWMPDLIASLRGGLNIMNGLHTRLANDPRLVPHVQPGKWIWDIRQEPEGLGSGTGAARLLPGRRVLFVGTDMSIGKMSAAIAFHRAALQRSIRSKFVATGQTGIMLAGDGIPLDAIRVDYAAGAVQHEVLQSAPDHEILFIEGQGSLLNPASTATLPLMRGAQPTDLVLVHRPYLHHLRDFRWVKVPPLRDVIAMTEAVASAGGAFAPSRVRCVVLNTQGLSREEAKYEIVRTATETGLPCDDVVRHGADRLLESLFVARS